MANQLLLHHPSVSSWCGEWLPAKYMERISLAYQNNVRSQSNRRQKFRQIILLKASNRVQMRNFCARLRKEQKSGLQCSYFVLLLLDTENTSTELRNLISNYREFRLSFLFYGRYAPPPTDHELAIYVDYVLVKNGTKPEEAIHDGAPLIHAKSLKTGDTGLLDIPTETQRKTKREQEELRFESERVASSIYREHERWKKAFDYGSSRKKRHRRAAFNEKPSYIDQERAHLRDSQGMNMMTAFSVLGLPPPGKEGYQISEVKRNYKRLVVQYHPDKLSSTCTEEEKQKATDRFTRLTEAFNFIRTYYLETEK